MTPPGGLAGHVDAMKFLPHVPQTQYPAGALAAALYLVSGVRSMERGTISMDRDEARQRCAVRSGTVPDGRAAPRLQHVAHRIRGGSPGMAVRTPTTGGRVEDSSRSRPCCGSSRAG